MRFHARLLAVAWIALSVGMAGTTAGLAQTEKRIALVIGNSAYRHTGILANPKNDAEAVAKLLKTMGFADVRLRTDLDYGGMREGIRLFGKSAADAEIALIYFAGHGLEISGENYLVPVDARLAHVRDLEYETVSLASVLSAVESARRLKLVILDACRNNPLGHKIVLRSGPTRGLGRGLGRIEPTGEVLVAYAAKAGTLAEDGAGKHSPYAQALLKHMATPGLDVIRMFGRVKEAVLEATQSAQEPWIYGSPGGEPVALVPALARPAPPEKIAPAPPAPSETPGARLIGVWGEHASACKDFKEDVNPAWASGKYFRISETYFDRCRIEAVQAKGAEFQYELVCMIEGIQGNEYKKTTIASVGSNGRLRFKSRAEHDEHFDSLQKYQRCE
jgi:uncharacterized caspase-like protein